MKVSVKISLMKGVSLHKAVVTPVIPALWEAEAGGSPEVRDQDHPFLPWPTW